MGLLAFIKRVVTGGAGTDRPLGGPAPTAAVGVTGNARCTVYFSPRGGCTAAIIAAVAAAKTSVLVQAYGFTSGPIADALIAAHKRGVTVRLVLDSDGRGTRFTQADECAAAGIEVTWDAKHLIAHNKVMVVDGRTVVTGSFNFSASAEVGNAENLLVVVSKPLAAAYAKNWDAHRGHSTP